MEKLWIKQGIKQDKARPTTTLSKYDLRKPETETESNIVYKKHKMKYKVCSLIAFIDLGFTCIYIVHAFIELSYVYY